MGAAISRVITNPGVEAILADYYDAEGPFAARTFDDLGENPPDEVTIGDLLAVTLLDISWSPKAVRVLLDTGARRMSELLQRIGPDEDLWAATPEKVAAANDAWQFLRSREVPFVGPVGAGKLLARKRPRLVPIHDRVIGQWLPSSPKPGFWDTLRRTMADPGLRQAIERVRPAGADAASVLRLLDVAVWMTGSGSKNVKESHRRHGFVPPPVP